MKMEKKNKTAKIYSKKNYIQKIDLKLHKKNYDKNVIKL